MRKIIFIIIGIVFFSCEKKAKETTVETTSVPDVEASANTNEEKFQLEELEKVYESKQFDNLDFSKLKNITLIEEESTNYRFPVLENDHVLCSNINALKIKDLISKTRYELYEVTKTDQASLAALGFTGSLKNKETLIIKDYVRTKDLNCDGVQRKVGIGLRCFIHITSKNYNGGANLAYLAANVQLGKEKANFSIVSMGFGIDGKEFSNIKSTGTYDVNSFLEIEKTYDRIISYLNNDNTMEIAPVYLP